MENMGYQENYLPFCQAGLGNEVEILCSKHYPKSREFIKKSNNNINLSEWPLRIKRLNSLFIQNCIEQNWYLNLRKEINNCRPDIIHLHNIWDLPTLQYLLINLFNNKGKANIFVDNHIDNGNFEYRNIYKIIYYFGLIKRIAIPLMLRRKFTFISVNPYSEYCLYTYFGIPEEKIRYLPLGIDNEKIFFSQVEREKMREKYAVKENDIVFTFSGVFEYNKSLPDLITAFKVLAKKYRHVYLLMIGDGEMPQDEEFNLLKKERRIILSGWQPVDKLYWWYSMADIGVIPGKLGGIRDILAAARPLIINDDLAVSYLLEYKNGLIFRRGNIKELICAMDTYIKNPNLIREHGEKSLRLTNEKLSWRNVASRSLQIYKEG